VGIVYEESSENSSRRGSKPNISRGDLSNENEGGEELDQNEEGRAELNESQDS